jgi:hypothetical protein
LDRAIRRIDRSSNRVDGSWSRSRCCPAVANFQGMEV